MHHKIDRQRSNPSPRPVIGATKRRQPSYFCDDSATRIAANNSARSAIKPRTRAVQRRSCSFHIGVFRVNSPIRRLVRRLEATHDCLNRVLNKAHRRVSWIRHEAEIVEGCCLMKNVLKIKRSFLLSLSLSLSVWFPVFTSTETRNEHASACEPARDASLRSSHGRRSSAEIPVFIRRARRLETISTNARPYTRRSKRVRGTQYGTVRHQKGKLPPLTRREENAFGASRGIPLVSRDAASTRSDLPIPSSPRETQRGEDLFLRG